MTDTITLALEIGPGDHALTRVVAVCARRRCVVEHILYCRRRGRAELTLRGPAALLARVPLWLDNVVDVRGVEVTGAPVRVAGPT